MTPRIHIPVVRISLAPSSRPAGTLVTSHLAAMRAMSDVRRAVSRWLYRKLV